MFISVINANYNGETYLKEAIESVLNQDFDNFEFIIVDDASTDGSKEIIEEFYSRNKKLIKPIFRSKNSGQGESFNLGLSAAKGDIISFIDSDDIWFEGKLKRVHDTFISSNNYAIHQHNLQIVKNKTITKQKVRDILVTGDYFNATRKSRAIPLFSPTSGLSFRKDVLEKVLPIPKNFNICADGYLTRTCFCYGDVAADIECLGAYRIHNHNNTFENPNFSDTWYIRRLLIPNLNNYYKENNIDLWYPRRRLVAKLLNISPLSILQLIIPERLFEEIEFYLER